LRAIEHRAYSLRNPPARVQFQPTEVGLALRCARIAFAVAYPEFTLNSDDQLLIAKRERSFRKAIVQPALACLTAFVAWNGNGVRERLLPQKRLVDLALVS
jgi:hypothetical protein